MNFSCFPGPQARTGKAFSLRWCHGRSDDIVREVLKQMGKHGPQKLLARAIAGMRY